MGKKGGSSTSSSSTSSDQYDQRVGLEGGGLAVGADADVSISLIDPGAIEMTGDLMDFMGEQGGNLIESAFELAESSQGLVKSNQELLTQFYEENGKESSERLGGKALDVAIPLGLAYLAYKAVKS